MNQNIEFKDFYQLGYSAAMQKMQSTASNEDDINPETGKEYFSTLTPEKFSKHLGDKAVQQAAKEYMLRSEGSQLVYEAFLAGASFNSDAVEFAEWIGKEDLKLYAEGWCQPGGSNGFHYTTQELYILFRSDKNKIQQAHDKAQYE